MAISFETDVIGHVKTLTPAQYLHCIPMLCNPDKVFAFGGKNKIPLKQREQQDLEKPILQNAATTAAVTSQPKKARTKPELYKTKTRQSRAWP